MVFQKLSDQHNQLLFEMKETHSKDEIAVVRALLMRGCDTESACKTASERCKAKQDYIDQVEKQAKKQQAPPAKEKTPEKLPKIAAAKAKQTPAASRQKFPRPLRP